jgi:hypothetical protein
MGWGVLLLTKLLTIKYWDDRFYDGKNIEYVYVSTEAASLKN